MSASNLELTGVYAAVLTPQNKDLSVDLRARSRPSAFGLGNQRLIFLLV